VKDEALIQSQSKKVQGNLPKVARSITTIKELSAGPSILSYIPAVIPIALDGSVSDIEHKNGNISRSSSTSSSSEEAPLTDEQKADAKEISSKRIEEKRRKENKQIFGGRIASSHLLAQLERRCTHNTRCDRNMDAGYHCMRGNVLQRWHRISNVHLEVGMDNADITCMEFDSEGVLLAIADNSGYIRIFCFDEVNAADILLDKYTRKALHERKKLLRHLFNFA
jgi:hypothetical protein